MELDEGDDYMNCRAKWQGLRTQYNTNKVKLMTSRSRNDVDQDEEYTVRWRFYYAMSFVDECGDDMAPAQKSNFSLVISFN